MMDATLFASSVPVPPLVGPHLPPHAVATKSPTEAEAQDSGAALEGTATGRTTVLPRVVAERSGLRLEPRQGARYTVRHHLGAGSMGQVELGEDLDIGRPVAIKSLRSPNQSAGAVARFVDEVHTMGLLDHPNITPIYDVGRDDAGRLFFTMKYVDGDSLETLVSRLAAGDPATHDAYPLARRLDVFVSILHALDYAHTQGVVHRDIKPANVMVGEHGEVCLVDWGIARGSQSGATPTVAPARPELTQEGAVLGTPLYMSPEQARGDQEAVDARSDLYSVFVVLFELLTLRRYVRDETSVFATLQEVLDGEGPWHDPHAWTHSSQPAIPIELRYFVRRGLHKDPQQRFASAAQAIAELERLRSGEIQAQCAITMFKAQQHRVGSFADTHPNTFMGMVAGLGVGALGVLALAGVGVAALL